MELTTERRIGCPYCGETITIVIDLSAGAQEYIEDCQVCCRPILMRIDTDGEGMLVGLEARREDE